MARSATTERSAPSERVSVDVVSAVADLTDSDPLSLPPLNDAIDPEALDALFGARSGSDRAPRRVSFTYCGCDVTVSGDGEVRVSKSTSPHRDE